ncbi:MAG: oxidoreductase [Calditrichaceae bacterium]
MNNQNWTKDNIPDQKNRVIIVTGSSSGIGFEAAKALAEKNAAIIIAVRNEEKGKHAIERIKEAYAGARVELMLLDLADLKSVKEFADTFKKKYNRLDLLINNAGVMIPPYSKTKDGFELQFGTNHLGHFALTGLLIDPILKTEGSRIVNVSSGAHRYGNINFDDLNWEKRKYKKWTSYGDSKIANLYFTYELQRKRALPTLRAAIDPDAKSGDYFGPDGWMQLKGYPVKVESNKLSHNEEIAKKLWSVSEELTGVKYPL